MGSRHFEVGGLHVRHAPAVTGPSSRPPLLLVHGAGHGAWCWELWMQVLPTKGWECFALSLRGHPGSLPVDRDTYCKHLRVADYAADVREVARHIGRPSVIIGHSMGGIVTQQYIAEQTAQGKEEAAAGGSVPHMEAAHLKVPAAQMDVDKIYRFGPSLHGQPAL